MAHQDAQNESNFTREILFIGLALVTLLWAYSVKLYGSVNYGFVITATFLP